MSLKRKKPAWENPVGELECIGCDFPAELPGDHEMIQHLLEYKSQFGNLLIPQSCIARRDGHTIDLGGWVQKTRQRCRKGMIDDDLKQTLDSMGFVWNVNCNLGEMIQHLQEYKSQFGNLLVPQRYKIRSCGNTINLGAWVHSARQRYRKGDIKDELKQTLDSMDFVWNALHHSNDEMIHHLQEYKSQFGNLLVPQSYKIQSCGKAINLGRWVQHAREKYRKSEINEELKQTLNSMGFVWNVNCNLGEMMQHLQEYKSQFGNLLVPKSYKIQSCGNTINLGTWVQHARQDYKRGKMKDELKETLHSMGFVWDACASAEGRHGLNRQKSSHDPTKPGAHKLTGYWSTQNSYQCHNVSHPCDDFTGSASNEIHCTSSLHTPEPKKRKHWRPPTPYPVSDDEEIV